MTDLEPVRNLAVRERRVGGTHWADCHHDHVVCALAVLLREVDEVEADNDDLRVVIDQQRAEIDRLHLALAGIARRRCLCDGCRPPIKGRHGGPCCGVAGGLCVTCEARAALTD